MKLQAIPRVHTGTSGIAGATRRSLRFRCRVRAKNPGNLVLDDRRRLELLAAIGIDVYRLRDRNVEHGAFAAEAGRAADPTATPLLVVAGAHELRREPWQAQRFRQVARALGVADTQIAWVDVQAGRSEGQIPIASAYLLVGREVASAVSAKMTLSQQQSATVAAIDAELALARDAAGRRALWVRLKPLARRLRERAE